LTLATMAADSGVPLGMILVPSSFDIRCFPRIQLHGRSGAREPHRHSL